jgi:hypothetical protein
VPSGHHPHYYDTGTASASIRRISGATTTAQIYGASVSGAACFTGRTTASATSARNAYTKRSTAACVSDACSGY